jgi:hypothetical protein
MVRGLKDSRGNELSCSRMEMFPNFSGFQSWKAQGNVENIKRFVWSRLVLFDSFLVFWVVESTNSAKFWSTFVSSAWAFIQPVSSKLLDLLRFSMIQPPLKSFTIQSSLIFFQQSKFYSLKNTLKSNVASTPALFASQTPFIPHFH